MKSLSCRKINILALIFTFLNLSIYGQNIFLLDPMIKNNGPVIKLVTSDLPKEPLIILKGNLINWENPGIRIEQLRVVAEALNIRFSYSLVPWARALRMVELGDADAAFVAGFSEERAQWGQFPMVDGRPDENRAISRVSYWLYSKKDSSVSWDGTNLTGVSGQIGANNRDLMTDLLREEGYGIVEVKTYEQMINMLLLDRLGAAVGFRNLLDLIISEDPLKYQNIIKHPVPLRIGIGYLMFSKSYYSENSELVDDIWDMIGMLFEDGTMNELYRKWDYK